MKEENQSTSSQRPATSKQKSKTTKALGLVFLGLIIWCGISYLAISFLEAETNPFVWSEGVRGAMLFLILCYICLIPFLVITAKDEM